MPSASMSMSVSMGQNMRFGTVRNIDKHVTVLFRVDTPVYC